MTHRDPLPVSRRRGKGREGRRVELAKRWFGRKGSSCRSAGGKRDSENFRESVSCLIPKARTMEQNKRKGNKEEEEEEERQREASKRTTREVSASV